MEAGAPIQCTNCGESVPPRARFCANCGIALASSLQTVSLATGQLHPSDVLQGRYLIVRIVARGGMSVIYQATDSRLGNTPVAVKEMSSSALLDPVATQQAIQDFRQEAQMLARLKHPNLPNVTDYFTERGRHYLVMDFIEGETLDEVVNQTAGFLDEKQVIEWGIQLCNVLDYLHRQHPPIIFRDLKPLNVMLDATGIKLIDFGIARLFTPGKAKDTAALGTPGFAPPEQYGKGQTDARSDIYALGATLHHLLTKHDPVTTAFNFPPVQSINPGISAQLSQIIHKALAIDPAARYQSAHEMEQALLLAIKIVIPPPDSQVTAVVPLRRVELVVRHIRKWRNKHRYLIQIEVLEDGRCVRSEWEDPWWIDDNIRSGLLQSYNRIINADLMRRLKRLGTTIPPVEDLPKTLEGGIDSELEDLGKFLCKQFLSSAVRHTLYHEAGANTPLVVVTNDPEIPWELIHTVDCQSGDDFLCLRNHVGRRLPKAWYSQSRPLTSPSPRVLLVANMDSEDTPAIKDETLGLRKLIEQRGAHAKLLLNPSSFDLLLEAQRGEYDVFHYAGHAFFDPRMPGRSYLELAGGQTVDALEISKFLKGGNLIFLNACESGAEDHIGRLSYPGSKVNSFAGAIMHRGNTQCFIGAQWLVFDDLAAEFALAFYEQLLHHRKAVGEALAQARAQMRTANPEDATWASYVLYGDPELRFA